MTSKNSKRRDLKNSDYFYVVFRMEDGTTIDCWSGFANSPEDAKYKATRSRLSSWNRLCNMFGTRLVEMPFEYFFAKFDTFPELKFYSASTRLCDPIVCASGCLPFEKYKHAPIDPVFAQELIEIIFYLDPKLQQIITGPGYVDCDFTTEISVFPFQVDFQVSICDNKTSRYSIGISDYTWDIFIACFLGQDLKGSIMPSNSFNSYRIELKQSATLRAAARQSIGRRTAQLSQEFTLSGRPDLGVLVANLPSKLGLSV